MKNSYGSESLLEKNTSKLQMKYHVYLKKKKTNKEKPKHKTQVFKSVKKSVPKLTWSFLVPATQMLKGGSSSSSTGKYISLNFRIIVSVDVPKNVAFE